MRRRSAKFALKEANVITMEMEKFNSLRPFLIIIVDSLTAPEPISLHSLVLFVQALTYLLSSRAFQLAVRFFHPPTSAPFFFFCVDFASLAQQLMR